MQSGFLHDSRFITRLFSRLQTFAFGFHKVLSVISLVHYIIPKGVLKFALFFMRVVLVKRTKPDVLSGQAVVERLASFIIICNKT